MKKLIILLLIFYFDISWSQNWNNLVPNYSFEIISSYPTITNINNSFGECLPQEGNDMDYIVDYWTDVNEWTHPLKEHFWCGIGGDSPVPTADIMKYGYSGHSKDFSRSGGYYYGRASRESLEDDKENLVVPIEGCFDNNVGPCLNSNKVYYIEFYFYTTKSVEIWLNNTQPQACGEGQNSLVEMQQKIVDFEGTSIIEFNSPATPNLDNKWKKFSGYFIPVDDNNKWLAISSEGPIDDIKIYELDENLCRGEWYFDNTVFVKDKEIFQAGDFIKAGYGVDPEAGQLDGSVTVLAGAHTIFTAGNAIYLEPGFEVELGAIFETDTIPCRDLCPPLNVNIYDKTCVSNSTKIGVSEYENTTIQATWSPSTYLDDPHSPNPTFTPPPGNGEITYTVFYYAQCANNYNFETVNITYTDQPNTAPSIAVSNVVYDAYNFSADITVNSVTNEVVLTYQNVDGNSQTITYERGVYFNSNSFQITLSNATHNISCCNNVNLNFVANTFCGLSASQNLVWEKNNSFVGLSQGDLPIYITPDGDGVNDYYSFYVEGGCSYEFLVIDRWGAQVYEEANYINYAPGTVQTNWHGQADNGNLLVDGDYWVIIRLFNDCGNSVEYYKHVKILGSGQQGTLDPNNPIQVDVYQQNGMVFIKSNSSSTYTVSINNAMGQTLFFGELTPHFSKQLENGVYFINILNSNQEIELKEKITIIN